MKSRILFLVMLLCANVSHAKYIYEYMDKVEPLLMAAKYDEADQEFAAINKRVRQQAISGYLLSDHYKRTVEWLKNIDSYHAHLRKIESNMSQYKAAGNGEISLRKCESSCEYLYIIGIDNGKPKSFPYSEDFMTYINNHRNSAVEKFYALNEQLSKQDEARKEKAIAERELNKKQEQEDRLRKKEEKRLARKAEEEAKKQATQKEIDRIDILSKEHGYSGYAKVNIIKLIYDTQKNGGLENYINKVVGCHKLNNDPCLKWYPKLKAIQILDDSVLYSFSEYAANEYLTFTILAAKEKAKIYQEGQSFKNDFFVFKGMTSYTTVSGARKSVPVFEVANLGSK
ncbi:hypothetical protein [Microbulbifer rhizosphaerae]|uniref:Uncharacterized protein n=1 Tax=Microbulbifer rhizosphaerae TaxID=1562603 RepID=A0A7W4W801_9GAMM|nr:hypothetical protein [Microbulbifer rhizosphaerae]MBB3059284.1 hypothetical protein [Microbulbifer rhizosphaerae]